MCANQSASANALASGCSVRRLVSAGFRLHSESVSLSASVSFLDAP